MSWSAHRTIVKPQRSLTLLTVLVLSACGGNDSAPTTPSPGASTTTFSGTLAGSSGQSGTLTVTIQAQVSASVASIVERWLVVPLHAQAASVTGSVHLTGSTTQSLTGTYDATTKVLDLSGGGFVFNGTVSTGVLNGTYTGPNSASGVFSTRSTTGVTVTVYCGSIFQGASTNAKGAFNLVISPTGGVSGAFRVPDNSGFISGQVNGTALSITYTDPKAGASGTASGTVQGATVSGRSESGDAFSASTAACQ